MPYTESESNRCRRDFPALGRKAGDRPLAYLDGPGGTQVPQAVIDAVSRCYRESNANFDGQFATSTAATEVVHAARLAVADFLGAPGPREISFGANMTTLNFALSHAIERDLSPGDEVVVTQLDHEANRGPWLGLARRGIRVREARLTTDGSLDGDHLAAQINERTRVVAIGIASNALGTVTDLTLARQLSAVAGARLVVDAVHYAAHFPLDVMALDVDFLLCSAYKFYGPHVGILYSRPGLLERLDTDHLCTQKDMAPYRIETGTLNHAALAGVTAAIDYIARWGSGATRRERIVDAMREIGAYEHELARGYYDGLRSIAGVERWGPDFAAGPRAPTVSITIAGVRAELAAKRLGEQGLQLWHGHFYAIAVLQALGLVERGGLLRTGISMYNTRQEIARLLAAVAAIAA